MVLGIESRLWPSSEYCLFFQTLGLGSVNYLNITCSFKSPAKLNAGNFRVLGLKERPEIEESQCWAVRVNRKTADGDNGTKSGHTCL